MTSFLAYTNCQETAVSREHHVLSCHLRHSTKDKDEFWLSGKQNDLSVCL